MVEQVDSGFSSENLSEAEALWANLPVGNRSWTGLATHEKALVCHTVQRLRIAAEARGMEAAFAMIPEMGRKIEKERLREARSWGGPTMYTPLNLEELITAIRAALNGGQHE